MHHEQVMILRTAITPGDHSVEHLQSRDGVFHDIFLHHLAHPGHPDPDLPSDCVAAVILTLLSDDDHPPDLHLGRFLEGKKFYAEPSNRLYTFLALANQVNILNKCSTTCMLGQAHLLGHCYVYDTDEAGQYASAS
jgi:hypothetical protein